MGMVFPIVLFIGIFYFLILRPQKKKQKQHDSMISAIGRGDTIVTAGGFFGVVRDVLEDSFIIEVADGVKMRILKSSISVRRDLGAANKSDEAPKPRKKKRPRPEGDSPANDDDSVTNAESAALGGETPEAETEAQPQQEPEPVEDKEPETEPEKKD